jgi:hypothetical protein
VTAQDAKNDAGPSQWGRNSDPLNVAVKKWPTPTKADGERGSLAYQGNHNPTLLGAAKMFPTPLPSDVDGGRTTKGKDRPNETGLRRAVWPTPGARLGDQRGAQAKRYHNPERSNDLDDAVAATGTTGQLNADWVSILMGFPADWTVVDGSAESRESSKGRGTG